MSDKKTKKKLSAPDLFQVKALSVMDWVVKHKTRVIIALAPIVIAILAVTVWNVYSRVAKENRAEALAAVDVMYEKESEAADKRRQELLDRLTELREQKSNAEKPAADPKPADEKKVEEKSADEKPAKAKVDIAAIEAQIAAEQAKLDKVEADRSGSLKAYREFFNKNSQVAEGWRAGLTSVRILLDMNKLQEADELLKELAEKSQDSDFYKRRVSEIQAAIAEENGNWDVAIAAIDSLIESASENEKPGLLFDKGRILSLKNDREQALQVFEEIISQHQDAPESHKAQTAKALLQ